MGQCVYFVRTDDDLIKIGFTTKFHVRRLGLGVSWENLLLVRRATFAVEQELHQRFAQHVARGREYYHPAPEIIDLINDEREAMGLSLLDWDGPPVNE